MLRHGDSPTPSCKEGTGVAGNWTRAIATLPNMEGTVFAGRAVKETVTSIETGL